ncbi:hypothetical protein [Streptomyces parvus]|uniref:hypothetical protein n=1 Tax=Streptomyces parvus TaxID=66428 RepID=UPI0033DDA235
MPDIRTDDIPDTATRVRVGGKTYLSAASARADLELYPHLREREITADCGPIPLHMKTGGGHMVTWTAWSDGQIVHGRIDRPADLPSRLSATEDLVGHLIREAAPWRQGDARPVSDRWMRWLDATGASDEQVSLTVDERAVGPDRIATRLVGLTRYTVHCSDGTSDAAWVLREQVSLPDEPSGPRRTFGGGAMRARTSVLDDEPAALAAFAALDDHRPPVVTSTEAAPALGTTPAALRQAISRAHKNDSGPYSESVGRTNWYVMEDLRETWNSRPGHGPGRGHTRTAG